MFGVVKATPDIFTSYQLRDIISYTLTTRTFPEVTRKNLERCQGIRAVNTPHEWAFYEVGLKGC